MESRSQSWRTVRVTEPCSRAGTAEIRASQGTRGWSGSTCGSIHLEPFEVDGYEATDHCEHQQGKHAAEFHSQKSFHLGLGVSRAFRMPNGARVRGWSRAELVRAETSPSFRSPSGSSPCSGLPLLALPCIADWALPCLEAPPLAQVLLILETRNSSLSARHSWCSVFSSSSVP